MSDFSISILLQFPAMPHPYNVRVSPRQVYLLDRHTERRIEPDGRVVYVAPKNLPAELLNLGTALNRVNAA